jgi:hypothetical protein
MATKKVQVVLGVEGGLMEYEPCVFITEKKARKHIIDTFGLQGEDYLKVCSGEMTNDELMNKWGDKLEIHWYKTTIK